MPRNRAYLILITLATLLSLFLGNASAKKAPKVYPEQGKVVSVGTAPRTKSGGGLFYGGDSTHTRTVYTHTYKVETDTAIFLLDCGKTPVFSSTGGECGGDTKIKLGDTLHFRVEKSWAYIPTVETVNATFTNSQETSHTEEKLRILSQELKPDTKSNPTTQTTPPDSTSQSTETKQ